MRDKAQRDKPWIFRTYAGHSTARDSNALYRKNLAKGQTGLSVAFDLPTQTGYDSDHPLAKGEVGKVGVPISHLGDMRTLFDHIPLGEMNTSMTINATAGMNASAICWTIPVCRILCCIAISAPASPGERRRAQTRSCACCITDSVLHLRYAFRVGVEGCFLSCR